MTLREASIGGAVAIACSALAAVLFDLGVIDETIRHPVVGILVFLVLTGIRRLRQPLLT